MSQQKLKDHFKKNGLLSNFLLGLLLVCHFGSIAKGSEPEKPARQTTGFLYGGGLMLSQDIYQGADEQPLVLPLLGYRGEKLNVFGPFISYEFAEQGPISLFAQLAPRFTSFNASDSPVFTGMATRKKTVEAGIGYTLTLDQWQLRGSTLSELFGTSNGTEIKTTLSRTFRHGPFWMTPDVSVSYLSNDHVDYYYGVRANEASPTRPGYKGLNTTNQSIGLTFATPIFFEGMTRITVTNTWLGSEIRNSPLVDKSSTLSLRLLFTRFF